MNSQASPLRKSKGEGKISLLEEISFLYISQSAMQMLTEIAQLLYNGQSSKALSPW
jgi:hypothetical protein